MDFTGIVERLVAGRWIAGPELEDAMRAAKRLNAAGLSVIVNYLGEEITDAKEVSNTVGIYTNLIKAMKSHHVKGSISVKPSQLGLDVDKRRLNDNYLELADIAGKEGIFVWLDMEQPGTVPQTLRMYIDAMPRKNIGICIQAYLRRSQKDISQIADAGGTVRLVKGAYDVGMQGYRSRAEVERNYRRLMHQLFLKMDRFMIATHDRILIGEAMTINKVYGKKVQYGMLNGIENRYAAELAKAGENVSLYLPFGTKWTDYSYRRLREGSHVLLLASSLFRNQSV